MTDPRAELARLMVDGFRGRSLRGAWRDLNIRLQSSGEVTVSYACFERWYRGETFPRTRIVQMLLAEVVGRHWGEEIAKLMAPPFRAYARSLMKGEPMSKHSHDGARVFAMETLKDSGGKSTHQAVIVCVDCGTRAYHLRRMVESELFFRRMGWHVGRDFTDDKCPECAKVIKIKERVMTKEGPKVVRERQKTGNDRLVISMKIGDNFDESASRYKPGWSDVRIAEELMCPVDWVSNEREHFYPGSSGDDPDVAEVVAIVTALRQQEPILKEMSAALGSSVASTNALIKQVTDAQLKIQSDLVAAQGSITGLFTKLGKLEGAMRNGTKLPFEEGRGEKAG